MGDVDLLKLQADAHNMATDELQKAWTESYRWGYVYRDSGPEPDGTGIEELARMIADRPGDNITTLEDGEWRQDAAKGVENARQYESAYRAELKRRGIAPSFDDRTYTVSFGPITDSGAPSVDPHLDTGHYDDGHSFGWKKDAPSVDPHLDTGHYDDGHSFGWKQPSPPAKSTSALPVPAPILAIVGGVALLVIGGIIAFGRGGGSPAASTAPSANAIGAAASAASSVPATNAPGVICGPAPDVAIALSGAVSGTVTKACEPWANLAQHNARPNTPYCRLEGIPNPPSTVAGVYSSQVMFILGGTKYQLTFQYVADQRNKATNGTLPVTLQVSDGDGILGMSSWPATQEIPGNTGAGWHATAGSFSIGADGTTGTIDADFATNDGKTLHAKGTWTVAMGCPPVGH